MLKESDVISEIIYTGRKLKDEGLITSTDGNISIRYDRYIYITPSGVNKGYLKECDIAKVPIDADSIRDIKPVPSMEYFMHKYIYDRRENVNAIIHIHAPFSTAFAAKGIIPDYSVLLEGEILPKAIMVGEYKPGSIELAEAVGKVCNQFDIIMLKKHGIITLGNNIKIVLDNIERFEFLCKINIYSKLL